MTDKEKLIEILRVPIYPHELADPAEVVADYLLDNGVTVILPDETKNVYTVQEIEKIQEEAYDLGVESVLHNHFNLSWHDSEKVRKEVAKLQNALRWIPVTERLPNICEPVLVCFDFMGGKAVRASDRYGKNGVLWSGIPSNTNVTHWMPIPEPPKEVE